MIMTHYFIEKLDKIEQTKMNQKCFLVEKKNCKLQCSYLLKWHFLALPTLKWLGDVSGMMLLRVSIPKCFGHAKNLKPFASKS